MKNLIKLFAILLLFSCNIATVNASTTKNTTQQAVAKEAPVEYTMLQSPVVIVNNPYIYINKNVQFPAKFNKFSTLGLDYKPAMRESQAYIGVLIERDDVGNNIVPLSELKMFLKRTDAEKLTDIETGDRVMIKGKIFSAALGDPWMDITEMKILTPKNQAAAKK